MVGPSLMFEHALNPIKGWFDEAALDIEGQLSANVTVDPVRGGRVVHVQSMTQRGAVQVPELELGLAGTDMALFLIQGSDAFDVANPGTSPGGAFVHQSIAPIGIQSALVATGGYELQTTEFNSARTYVPGDLLTADQANADAVNGGLLDNQNAGDNALTVPSAGGGTSNAICGVVSRGAFNNEHGVAALHFWPVYLPGET